jgi:virginiamycin A acetyltransferase
MQQSIIQWIKAIAGVCARVAVLPARAWFEIQAVVLGRARACSGTSQLAAQWTGMPGIYLRRALLKHMIAGLGQQVSVGTGTVLTKPSIELGNFVYIGSYGVLGDVRIGDYTLVGDHVCILSGQHGIAPDALIKDQPEEFRTITIGLDCWIGSGTVILADVGNHCVVGAGSVVTKPVADYAIVAGNPAKPIGDRRQRRAVSEC